MTTWRRQLFVLLACCSVVWVMGCDEPEQSPRSYNYDLGSGDMILLPPAPPMLNAKIAEGSADLPEFREPGSGPDIEGDILAMIEEYNQLIEEKAFDELPAYFVEEQQEVAAKVFGFMARIMGKIDEIMEIVEEKEPDQAEEIEELLLESIDYDDWFMEIKDLNVISETAATAKKVVPEGQPETPGLTHEIHFKLGDDGWVMQFPDLNVIAMMIRMAEQGTLAGVDELIAALKSGEKSVADLAEELKTQAEMAKALQGQPAPGPEAEEGSEAEEPEEEAGAEEQPEDEEDEGPSPAPPPRRSPGTPG